MKRTITVIIALSFLLAGCTNSANVSSNQQRATLNMSAAATLTDVIKEINNLYSRERPDIKITTNFASSGTIQNQIENGAPTDIFFSGASLQMDNLEKKGLILSDTRKDLLSNQIVLIVPNDSTLSIHKFQDLTNNLVKKVAIGDPASVTAGMYAKKALEQVDIYQELKPKFVFGSDVRQVLGYVESGNVDAGFVYSTDAKISTKVKVVAVASANINDEIVYPVAIVESTKYLQAAKDYLSFLNSDKSKEIFIKYGFKVLK
jgi:molybdate transport system substrate-binding protein